MDEERLPLGKIWERWESGWVPFFGNNAFRRQSKDIEPSIPHKAKVLGGSYSDSRVEEGRVLNGVAIEALSTVFEHG